MADKPKELPSKKGEGMNKEVLQAAIDEWGVENQTIVAIEEMAELTKELTKSLRGIDHTAGITEEMADVYIMLEQVKMMYGVDESALQKMVDQKLNRLNKIVKGAENY